MPQNCVVYVRFSVKRVDHLGDTFLIVRVSLCARPHIGVCCRLRCSRPMSYGWRWENVIRTQRNARILPEKRFSTFSLYLCALIPYI